MPTAVFLGGRFVEPQGAMVSAFDAGFQHAVGLFETLLGGVGPHGPWAWRLDRHVRRLVASARDLGLSPDLRAGPLAEAILRTIDRSGLARARVRLTLTAGDLSLLHRPLPGEPERPGEAPAPTPPSRDPTVLVAAQPATAYPEEMFERGVAVVIADARASPLNPLEGHKTLSYWWRLRELQAAAARRAAEAVVLQVTNHVCGGCVSNLLLVRGGSLVTPIARGEEAGGSDHPRTRDGAYLPSPVVPGTVRAWALERAAGLGLATERRMVTIDDLLDSDEAFLTNSSWGVLPVIKVESSALGDGVPGKVAAALHRDWRAELASLAAAAPAPAEP
ncbi:MAG TPA: aminotransferase class IV [Phycisphaerales bacterium]|nr:aminotransferase class IV [Phycisphaerales bacterium]